MTSEEARARLNLMLRVGYPYAFTKPDVEALRVLLESEDLAVKAAQDEARECDRLHAKIEAALKVLREHRQAVEHGEPVTALGVIGWTERALREVAGDE